MPWVQEDERGEEPHDIGRSKGDDDGKERLIGEQLADCKGVRFDLCLD